MDNEGLYVRKVGKGVSHISCKYAAREAFAVQRMTGDRFDIKKIARCGADGFEEYERAMSAGRSSGKRSEHFLTRQLVGLEGKRVEVIDKYGQRRRFIVGKSTGWLPIHLEIARRTSHGGGGVYGTPFKSVRVILGGRR